MQNSRCIQLTNFLVEPVLLKYTKLHLILRAIFDCKQSLGYYKCMRYFLNLNGRKDIVSLHSKRSRTTRTKLGPREGVFSHSGCTKNEARAKKWKEKGGGGVRRKPSFPSPTPLLPPFCSRPIFRAARMRKPLSLGPNFVRIVRERLLGHRWSKIASKYVLQMLRDVERFIELNQMVFREPVPGSRSVGTIKTVLRGGH